MAHKILTWKCPDCDKEIISLYKEQFDYNVGQHKETHRLSKNDVNGASQ